MNTIDLHIGQFVRSRRRIMSMPASVLASHLDVDVEALEAIESGAVRLSASDLLKVCRCLDVTPQDIFEAVILPSDETASSLDKPSGRFRVIPS